MKKINKSSQTPRSTRPSPTCFSSLASHPKEDPKGRNPQSAFKRRRSKIAQLPQPLRHELNLLIQDNVPAKQILGFLARHGHTGINKVNITDWIHGHHNGSSGY